MWRQYENGIAEGEAIQVDAQDIKDKGVNIQMGDEILNALEAAWIEVVNEESANDDDFKDLGSL